MIERAETQFAYRYDVRLDIVLDLVDEQIVAEVVHFGAAHASTEFVRDESMHKNENQCYQTCLNCRNKIKKSVIYLLG